MTDRSHSDAHSESPSTHAAEAASPRETPPSRETPLPRGDATASSTTSSEPLPPEQQTGEQQTGPRSSRPNRRKRARRWILEIGAAVGIFLVIQSWQTRDLPSGGPSPALTLRDLDGSQVSLESFRGKHVLLHFWATWCGVCHREFGALNALHRDLPDDQVVLTVVADGENPERIREFVAKNELSYPILLGNDDITARFGVSAFPTTFFIAPDGTIDSATVGMSNRWAMRSRLSCAGF